jgi:hypothetical protein
VITAADSQEDDVSALSLDTPVSFLEAATAPNRAVHRAERSAAAEQHRRQAARPVVPRARRASATSTYSPALLGAVARLVGVRALGIGLAAAAVTFALASRGADAGTVASLSVRGLAAAAILGAAWGFQDRPRLGTLQTVRAWYGTAAVIGAAHALWIVATMPGMPEAHLAAALSTFALDAVLVATPALLGARAGRPDVPSTLN